MSDEDPPADHVYTDEGSEKAASPIEEHLKSGTTWMRGLFMLISWVLLSVASIAGSVTVLLGFLWVLFTGETNRQIQQVGQSLASYIYEIIRYMTFNSDEKPFPLGGAWPSSES